MRFHFVTLGCKVNQCESASMTELLRRAGISKLMAFVSGKNLLTLTNWVGDDPETGSTVLSATMPVARSVNVGVNLSF